MKIPSVRKSRLSVCKSNIPINLFVLKVGGLDLFEKHTELKDQSKKTKELERELNIVEESLKKEEATNNRLEGQVKAFVEKRKQEESILWLKRKQAVLVNKELSLF